MSSKKTLLGIIAGSLLLSTLKGASTNPVTVAVVDAPAPPKALKPFHEYHCGDPKLPTAYYFLDVHYDTDIKFRMADVYLQDPKDAGYEKNREIGEQYRKVAEEGLTCQEQIYLTLQQLQQERKISVGFGEGVHQGDSVEEYNRLVRRVVQNYSLVDLVEAFKTGLIAFAATQEFPVFGWESMTQEEYDKLSGNFYREDKKLWEYYIAHGVDTTYQSRAKAQNEKLDETSKERSNAAYDNPLAAAQQWMKKYKDAPRGYVVNIGAAHEKDIIERFKTDGHPNAVLYVCGE